MDWINDNDRAGDAAIKTGGGGNVTQTAWEVTEGDAAIKTGGGGNVTQTARGVAEGDAAIKTGGGGNVKKAGAVSVAGRDRP
jgi:hypothetical protein